MLYEVVPLDARNKLALDAIIAHGIKPDTNVGNPCHYLVFDPGKVTGFASFGENGMPTGMGHIYDWAQGVLNFMKVYPEVMPGFIIYEAYNIRGRGQSVDVHAVRTMNVIKTIKAFALKEKIPFHAQQAAILPVAAKFSGMEMPRDHSLSHQVSAFNHGWYKLTEDRIVIPRIKWPEG